MFNSFIVICSTLVIFAALYFAFKIMNSIGNSQRRYTSCKTIANFPINYKMSGNIIKIENKYYLCVENCGIIEIEYNEELKTLDADNIFKSILTKNIRKLKSKNIK